MISGTFLVTIADKELGAAENLTKYVLISSVYRLENPSTKSFYVGLLSLNQNVSSH